MRLISAALLAAATSGCASRTPSPVSGPPSPASEPLHITIVYPDTAEPIQAQDSSFLFGSVGRYARGVARGIEDFLREMAR